MAYIFNRFSLFKFKQFLEGNPRKTILYKHENIRAFCASSNEYTRSEKTKHRIVVVVVSLSLLPPFYLPAWNSGNEEEEEESGDCEIQGEEEDG